MNKKTQQAGMPVFLLFVFSLLIPLAASASIINPNSVAVVIDSESSSPVLFQISSTTQTITGTGFAAGLVAQLWGEGDLTTHILGQLTNNVSSVQSIASLKFSSPFSYPISVKSVTTPPSSVGFVSATNTGASGVDDGNFLSIIFNTPLAPGAKSEVFDLTELMTAYSVNGGTYTVTSSAGSSASGIGPLLSPAPVTTPEPASALLSISALALMAMVRRRRGGVAVTA